MRSMYAPMGIARLGFAYDMADGPGLMTSFGISIPIWRNELDAGVDSANHMVRMRSEDERAMERMIEGDVAAARERVVGAARRGRALRVEILPLAKQTLQLTVASYAGGDLPFVSVLDAASTLREKEMGGVVLDAQTVLAWIELGRAVGTFNLASLVAMPAAEGAP